MEVSKDTRVGQVFQAGKVSEVEDSVVAKAYKVERDSRVGQVSYRAGGGRGWFGNLVCRPVILGTAA